MKFEILLARFVTIALFTAVFAGTWDAWWHGVIGRESLWIPPHLLLYVSTLAAIGGGVFGWSKTKNVLWRNLALVLLLIFVAAPFDELWHRVFGIESAASPLIVWSPPHLILIGAITMATVLVLPIVFKDSDKGAKHFFASLAFAALIALTNFLSAPLNPLGPYHLMGFWGSWLETLFYVFLLFAVRKKLGGVASVSNVAIIFLVLFSVGFTHGGASLVEGIPAHEHAPLWLMAFGILIPAMALDLCYKKISPLLLGGIMGFFSNAVIYLFSNFFFQPEFQYGLNDTFAAIVAGVVAGVLAGAMSKILKESRFTA